MAKKDISQEEAQSYVELLKDAKLPAEMGYFLTTLKVKIGQAFQKEQKDQQIKYVKQLADEEDAKKVTNKRIVSEKFKKI